MALDTHLDVVTPEGVALHLPVAGPVPRALAWLIDFAVRLAVLFAAAMVLGLLGGAGAGAMSVLMFALFWFYPVLFEVVFDGRTPGKRALGLRVVAADGAPVGWRASFTRNLLRSVDMLPFGYATGLVACLADPAARRLGDMVARTLVVHVADAPDAASAPHVPAQPPRTPLQPAEQSAVVAFAERAPRLGDARRDELADLASPLVQAHGAQAAARLYAIAAWLLGRRA
ncbi:RDD family protein [Cognatilysobacter segetis]|uniref:RDD family protein n=1 Tax=Cognatilysobacter segetis TaxID=2492394 RepID=UPI00105E62F0|nr:RDD family protein [Lysobacter segetis]